MDSTERTPPGSNTTQSQAPAHTMSGPVLPATGIDGAPAVATSMPSAGSTILIGGFQAPATPNVPLVECDRITEPDVPEMAPFAVLHDSPPPRLLYSWTSAEQVDELRSNPTLLTRSISSDGEVGRAQGLIAELANSADPIATMLNAQRFANKRYAWTNPWATRLGWTGDDYGDRLLAIRLREESWVGRMIMSVQQLVTWSFTDMSGAEVSAEAVLANPERLAAMYFYDARNMTGCGFERVTQGSMYREYFVMNEEMIESWSASTPEIKAEVDNGVAALRALLQELDAHQCDAVSVCWRDGVATLWSSGPSPSLLDGYLASLAFPNDLYSPTRGNVAALIERMQAVPFDDEPLVGAAPQPPRSDAPDAGQLQGFEDEVDGGATATGREAP